MDDGTTQTDPAGHRVWFVDPDGQYVPATHAYINDVVLQYEPAGQFRGGFDDVPAGQYAPN